eukprot:scaffold690957_cov126-Attheya_sp.AAC.2
MKGSQIAIDASLVVLETDPLKLHVRDTNGGQPFSGWRILNKVRAPTELQQYYCVVCPSSESSDRTRKQICHDEAKQTGFKISVSSISTSTRFHGSSQNSWAINFTSLG